MPNLLINGIVSARDQRPYVQIDIDGKIAQLTIAEAHKVSADLTNAASYAEADAMLHHFFGQTPLDPEAVTAFMLAFHQFRYDNEQEVVLGGYSDPETGDDLA